MHINQSRVLQKGLQWGKHCSQVNPSLLVVLLLGAVLSKLFHLRVYMDKMEKASWLTSGL